MAKDKTNFERLYEINVNDKTESKEGLTYLSWAWAWAEFKKVHPEATYEVVKFDGGIPYAYDENTGYMVYTKVTADGLTHEMWLPVMDAHNKAMKNKPYTVKTKYKEIPVQAATMFDVNKAIMRCLTKNLAMFGLGLYIYAGEDLPDVAEEEPSEEELKGLLKNMLRERDSDVTAFLSWCTSKFGREIANVDVMKAEELKTAIGTIRQSDKKRRNTNK